MGNELKGKRIFGGNNSNSSSYTGAVTEFDPSIVISQTNTPAVGPSIDDAYLIGTSPTGVWVGHANEGAIWDGGAWVYSTPISDDIVYVTSLLKTLRYNGTSWVIYPGTAILQGGNSGLGNIVIGSNDVKELHLKTAGIPRVKIGTSGTVTTTSNIGVGTTSPHASSMLDVVSTTKGLRFPTMTTAQMNAIVSPATGLTIFNSSVGLHYYYNGTIWIPLNGSIINITYADLLTLYNAETMTAGTFYNITDRADNGIIIQAVSSSKLSLDAIGIFLNPDFQDVGDYSGTTTLTGFAKGTNYKVWVDTDEGSYADGDIVFWDGLHYQVIDISALPLGTNPSVTPSVYTVLPKSTVNMGYIAEADSIFYDLAADFIWQRTDKRQNSISILDGFQWGNDSVVYNIAFNRDTYFQIVNSKASAIRDNFITGAAILNVDNTMTSNINGCNFIGGSVDCIIHVYNTLLSCQISAYEEADSITLSNKAYSYKKLSPGFSNFDEELSITCATTLDVTIPFNYIGILELTSTNATETINLFANFPVFQPVRFAPETGLTVTFTHATGANQPICSGGVDAVINGTTSSWIEFTRKETYVGSGTFRIYETARGTY